VEKEAALGNRDHAFPRHPTLLTATAQNVPPHATLRIPPHDGHPVLRSTTASGFRFTLAVSGFRLRARLGFSIPSLFSGQRGITPAFGYSAPHPSAGGTLTLLNNALLSAHYTAVRLLEDVHAGSTALAFSRRPMVSFDHRYLRGLPVLAHEVYRRALGSSTTQDCPGTRDVVPVHVAFRTSVRRQHPDCVFSELNTQPTYPLFTLRLAPHGARRKTRGRAVR